MTDLVERLRDPKYHGQEALRRQAADEIERLRTPGYDFLAGELVKRDALIERLRAALKPFAKMYAAPGGDLDKAIQAARRVLEEK